MKINKNHIQDVLNQYGIEGNINNIFYLIEDYEKGTLPRAKVIVKAEMDNSLTYIIKFVLEEEHPVKLIEEQSIFSECMRANGINTAKRYKSCDKYCISYTVNDLIYAVTVEEYLGEELKFINYKIVDGIATLVAEMHSISQENNCHISGNTIWDIFDETTDISRGYKAFYEYRNNGEYDFSLYDISLYENIISLYEERLSRLKAVWNKLPRYATQGDYSTNNLVCENGRVAGIFDYNIAGDEILVSDMIIEGLFVCYEMDLDNGLTYDDRCKMFRVFIKKYMECRKLNQDEIAVMNDIYAVVYPFWWTRIIFDEGKSLKKYLDERNVKKVNKFFNETYNLLHQDHFIN